MHGHHQRRDRHHHHSHEILERIKARPLVQAGVDHKAGRGHQQRVTITGGARHQFVTDIAGGAGAVVDHHGLLPHLREMLANHARKYIRTAAGDKGHDYAQRARGVSRLGPCVWRSAK